MMRTMRRFTRLTNASSKKVENHAAAVVPYFMWYNFGRVHQALRVAPAVERASRGASTHELPFHLQDADYGLPLGLNGEKLGISGSDSRALEVLRARVRDVGRADAPRGLVVDGFGVGAWVIRARRAHRAGRLDPQLVRALSQLPGWSWSPLEDRWKEFLEYLRRFVDREGHARVPQDHREEGYALGRHLAQLRFRQRRGQVSRGHIRVVEALPGWTWEPATESWAQFMKALRRYVARTGEWQVPIAHPLSRRLQHVRDQYRLGRLSAARRRELEALPGWSASPREDNWQTFIRHLEQFASREGHTRVPAKHREGTPPQYPLGRRVAYMRELYWLPPAAAARRRPLSTAHKAQLEAMPGWSWGRAKKSQRRQADAARAHPRDKAGPTRPDGGKPVRQPARATVSPLREAALGAASKGRRRRARVRKG
jgi:Helicase associated domain